MCILVVLCLIVVYYINLFSQSTYHKGMDLVVVRKNRSPGAMQSREASAMVI